MSYLCFAFNSSSSLHSILVFPVHIEKTGTSYVQQMDMPWLTQNLSSVLADSLSAEFAS